MFASPKTTMRTIDKQMCPSHKGVRLTIVCLTEFFSMRRTSDRNPLYWMSVL